MSYFNIVAQISENIFITEYEPVFKNIFLFYFTTNYHKNILNIFKMCFTF